MAIATPKMPYFGLVLIFVPCISITDGFSEASEQSTGLADVVFSFGQYRFPVERNVFLQWQENIRQGVGFSDLEVQGEIKKRMKL